ncbi:MarR family winged helix-turn-helix transcriptional regulator [Jatrophihabitans sp. GAS493]|uniref:MarR family winged helix-turn-helix transcriptional regulator n=1 Tax=Jatrophihabitans sp. GAS493 TaxID=1907575 RepID=UPI0018D5244C|nr:MarR family transcriptional regulator [Jatrophihabitans sp. GAS493]
MNGTESAVTAAAAAFAVMRNLVLDGNDARARVAEELGMSFGRAKALRRLAHQPARLRDLAVALAIDAPYTTVIVDDLEQRGLVERRVDPADRRCRLVSVTPAGAQLAARADEILSTPPPALRSLPATELAELARILSRIPSA